jgi:ABC-type nitrate/sulfonate/bicarbonate transport system permease component
MSTQQKYAGLDWRGWALPILLLVMAQILGAYSVLGSDNLAAPSQIVTEMLKAIFSGALLQATVQTLLMSFAGLLIGGMIGTLVGIGCGLSQTIDRIWQFPVEVLRPIPSIALLPLALLVFGFGYRMEIALVAFAAIWPMLILTRTAVRNVEPRLYEVTRILDFSVSQRVRKIILPAILPRLIVALRISIGLALVVSVTVEVAANPLGLGYGMLSAQESLQPALSLAFLIWIGVLGYLLNAALGILLRRVAPPGFESR